MIAILFDEIQNVLDFVIFFMQKSESWISSPEVPMRSFLPTAHKESVSLLTFKRSKNKTSLLEVFSKIQMIIFPTLYFSTLQRKVQRTGFVILVVLL
jgi:hypothetical protein